LYSCFMISKILKTSLYNQFYYDFISGENRVREFLLHPKFAEWDILINRIESDSYNHQYLKEVLIKQNADLDSEHALKHLSDLKNKNSIIVITGQQLGLFASPIYTIYKAVTTVKISAALNRENPQYKFVPVFWLESEDHDFEEVNHFGIWNSAFKPQIITYHGENRGKMSIRHYNFTPEIEVMIHQIEEMLQHSDFTPGLLERIRRSYLEGNNWVEAVRNFLKMFFKFSGLLFFQPGAPEVKKISVDFFKKFLAESTEIQSAFSSRSSELTELGYANQVTDIPGKTYIHIEDENFQRIHLYRERNSFEMKETGKSFNYEEIISIVQKYPDKISTAVVSRPLLQSWLLPVAVYVAGPAEIAYWAQLGGIFEYMNLQMPVLYPRISATLIEPKIQRYIEKHTPDIQNISQKADEFIDNYFKKSLIGENEKPFRNINVSINGLMTDIKKYLANLDKTLLNTADKTAERIKQQLYQLEQKSLKAREQKEQVLFSQLTQIHAAFFPEGIPQERFASPIYYLNKFGDDFIDRLFQKLSAEIWDHQIADIG
jgi:bacillithiol biosynthesis cysteine-adding enzyme BshC